MGTGAGCLSKVQKQQRWEGHKELLDHGKGAGGMERRWRQAVPEEGGSIRRRMGWGSGERGTGGLGRGAHQCWEEDPGLDSVRWGTAGANGSTVYQEGKERSRSLDVSAWECARTVTLRVRPGEMHSLQLRSDPEELSH